MEGAESVDVLELKPVEEERLGVEILTCKSGLLIGKENDDSVGGKGSGSL